MANNGECDIAVAMELVSVGVHERDDDGRLANYVRERIGPLVEDTEFLLSLVASLTAVASSAIIEWADDTERPAEELLRAWALAHASSS